ncbi:N-acetylglucosaminyl-phosphatidylinositol de-N-acetylase [Cryptosporidium canis]|uniref:N-acetylglucosaminylphosphatidylinositol deacetylase n=1 Tax=Cryptosporidium canis TaxID=195482 RepID=A0A9D5HXX3_9CRYT|nr:N-acetylglucosaminyl-phosphatidylinositol de-N-acetylase [Cryptosporidium canis]
MTCEGFNGVSYSFDLGNYYGLGKVREKELYDACGELGITKERVRVVSNDRLQDQPNERWSHKDVIHEVESFVDEHSIDFIVTFDEYGVSGHINHISTYESLREWIRGSQRESYPKVYVLETSNIFIKYSGLFSMVYYYFFPTSGR